jgi:DNA-binding response OmpR family regulator
LRILFVENAEVFARVVIEQFLSGHEVIVVPSLAGARRALAAGRFDAALVDYDLDDGKGDALVRELRAAGSRLRIIGVSSKAEGTRALLAAGVDASCGKLEFAGLPALLAAT